MSCRLRAGAVASLLALLPLPSCLSPDPVAPDPRYVVFRTADLAVLLKPPADYDSTATYPLLVALHGNGGTALAFAPALSPFARTAFFVAVPQGLYAREDGGFSWFALTRERALWETLDTRSVASVAGLIAALRASYPIGDVFVLGFSQGASLAYLTGLRHPALVSGVIAIGGRLPLMDTVGAIVHAQDVDRARGVPIFVARGADDALVGRRTFLAQVDFWTSRGYAVTSHEYDGGHHLTAGLMDRVLEWLRERARR